MNARTKTTVELERTTSDETWCWIEPVEAVGDVDLEGGTVDLLEPRASEYSPVHVQTMRDALYLEAEAQAKYSTPSPLVAELMEMGAELARIAAVDDRGPEADLGLAAAVEAAAS